MGGELGVYSVGPDGDSASEDLTLSFDPTTIEHLGFKMYSHLPNALAELVANGYDADARNVSVTIRMGEPWTVEVMDDGHGMSLKDLESRYLRIGRNRRADTGGMSESGTRRVAGKKGLGKLALFGIGRRITVRTKRAGNDAWTTVVLDWQEIKNSSGGQYKPRVSIQPGLQKDHGTTITVEQLQRTTPIKVDALAASLSRLFNYTDSTFRVSVGTDSGEAVTVDRALRYRNLDIETKWRVPDGVPDIPSPAWAPAGGVSGEIFASKKPLRQEMRGVTLYVDGRLANEAEFFGVPESSHAFSYLTGYVDADYVNELEEDVIATDRRSVSWDSEPARELRDYIAAVLRSVARMRRETRRIAQEDKIERDLGTSVADWTTTLRGPEVEPLKEMLEILASPDADMPEEDRVAMVTNLNLIAPAYADMHWRHLHPEIRDAADEMYRSGHYLHAVVEAIKRFVHAVRQRTGIHDGADLNALQSAFGSNRRLDVFQPFLTAGLSSDTANNIRDCQRSLADGVWRGFRDPTAHHEIASLEGAGVFTYQDCLDALSILSHLWRRLDGAALIGGDGPTAAPA